MSLSLIVAMGSNRVIGVDNRMPWHLSADLKRFRHITLGKPVLMGRKTFESIGRPLPERTNIVLTGNPGYAAPGCVVAHSLEEALRVAGEGEVMVIGGAALYQACLPRAERLYLTLIHRAFAGDTFFPAFDLAEWREAAREDIADDPSGLSYSFLRLERPA